MKEQRLYYHTVELCDQLAKYCKQKKHPVPFQPLVKVRFEFGILDATKNLYR